MMNDGAQSYDRLLMTLQMRESPSLTRTDGPMEKEREKQTFANDMTPLLPPLAEKDSLPQRHMMRRVIYIACKFWV